MSREQQEVAAREALHFFQVQFDSLAEEAEVVREVLLAANPSSDVMGFSQRVYVEEVCLGRGRARGRARRGGREENARRVRGGLEVSWDSGGKIYKSCEDRCAR